ncbi:MAG: phage holin family protein [Phocaeicola sp.]
MFSNEQNIEHLEELFREIKSYVKLRQEHSKLELVEKSTILVSAALLTLVLLLLGGMVLFYLSFTLAHLMTPYVGGLAASFGIIAGGLTLLFLLVLRFRNVLIKRPLAKFLANIFLNKKP